MANTFGIQTADPIGLASATLALVGHPQVTSASTDCADDGDGEYVAASQISFGETKNLALSYKAQTSSAVTPGAVKLGGADAVACTSITFTAAKGARLTASATAHEHVGGTGTNHNDSTRTPTLPTLVGFGAQFFGLTGLAVAEAELQSSSYTIEIGHTDDDNNVGNWLCGTSHGEKHTASFEAVSDTAFTVPSGWVNAGKGPSEGNNAHGRQTITIVKYVAGP